VTNQKLNVYYDHNAKKEKALYKRGDVKSWKKLSIELCGCRTRKDI